MTGGPPSSTQFKLDSAKITGYLLDPDHPAGGPKARFFLRFGFSPEAPEVLAEALLRHPSPSRLVRSAPSVHGMKHIYDGPTQTPDGRTPSIRMVWIVDRTGFASFVTAYPSKE
ncbi:DUF6883 domain-containing protein [Methylobacterium sp. 17Sr1-1]|uniref:DUF6883 domain-containing protein n=1 Tax=Methylobacterium sp. 17Sr1-1 TaxID=2202826 RepID=UPI000D6F7758|nr:DUF6883 domain-containing protein [Methylobacterium sp. 17Sr1-1]AWN52687.1 hypothetical protein DK412_14480 [Methylobacterium sp. 17Sr1-1]